MSKVRVKGMVAVVEAVNEAMLYRFNELVVLVSVASVTVSTTGAIVNVAVVGNVRLVVNGILMNASTIIFKTRINDEINWIFKMRDKQLSITVLADMFEVSIG